MEDKPRCERKKWDTTEGRFRPCEGNYWKDGFCHAHHPETVAKRDKATRLRLGKKMDNTPISKLCRQNAALEAEVAKLRERHASPKLTCSAINIVFDGPPAHAAGRFVEVETDDGRGINAGEWIEKPDGMWILCITQLPAGPPEAEGA